MRAEHDSHKGKEGFTLVEIVVAAILFALALAAIANLILTLMNAVYLSERTSTATELVQDKMEELLATSTGGATTGNESLDGYTLQWSTTGNSGQTLLTTTISWSDTRGKEHSISMSSMLATNRLLSDGLTFQNIPEIGP